MRYERESGRLSRRVFLHAVAGSAAAAGLAHAGTRAIPSRVVRPGWADDVRVAVLGLNGRGNDIGKAAERVEGVKIVALCDADTRILERRAGEFAERGSKADTYQDMRRVFDRKDIDAVLVATPNHWHALAAVWACQAGKDVYVEKPVSHSVWEGRQIVRAADHYGRIVQAGLQNRSDTGLRAFKSWFGEGHLGKPQWCHTVWYRHRGPIGKVSGPTPIPSEVDYDLFCGPREVGPLMRKNLHYDWHWQSAFGDGELANSGVHVIDEARWMLDLGMPERLIHAGERVAWDDDGDTPNVSFTVAEFGGFPMIVEARSMPASTGSKDTPKLRGRGMVTLIMCEKGYFMGGRGGGTAFHPDGSVFKEFKGDSGSTHMANFVECVRSRRAEDLRTSIEEGHRSSAFCHLSQVGHQLGRHATMAEVRGMIESIEPAGPAFDAITPHLEANGVDCSGGVLKVSGWMDWDQASERFTSGESLQQANAMLRAAYREPFVVPEVG